VFIKRGEDMPKVIKHIEEKIFNAAMKLFGEKGYSNVEMKIIAKEAGIAVGTLYNYYRNKKELFAKVFEYSWEVTFSKLDEVIESHLSVREKMERCVITLYEEVENRKGMGRELTKANVINIDKDKTIWIKNILKEKIYLLVNNINSKDGMEIQEDMSIRFVETLLILTITMLNEHPDEKEKNIRFINQMLHLWDGTLKGNF
jgi:AcrR family transcriptional regulator